MGYDERGYGEEYGDGDYYGFGEYGYSDEEEMDYVTDQEQLMSLLDRRREEIEEMEEDIDHVDNAMNGEYGRHYQYEYEYGDEYGAEKQYDYENIDDYNGYVESEGQDFMADDVYSGYIGNE